MNQTILIVEDEIVLQDVYKLVLTSKGYNVATASNGADGLTQLRKVEPRVVLLDIFMPVMDGKEFLRNVDIADYPNTTFIVYSNLSDSKTQSEMLELGAHKFVLKSNMSPDDLLALIAEAVTED